MKTPIATLLLILMVSLSSFASTTKTILPSPDNSVRRVVFNFSYQDESLKQFPCHFIIPNGETEYWEETLTGISTYTALYNSPEELHLKFDVPYNIDVKYQVTASSATGQEVNPYIYISGNQISVRLQQLIDINDVYIIKVTLSK